MVVSLPHDVPHVLAFLLTVFRAFQLFPPSSVDSVAGGLSGLSVGRTASPSPALAGFTSPFTMLGEWRSQASWQTVS